MQKITIFASCCTERKNASIQHHKMTKQHHLGVLPTQSAKLQKFIEF